MATTSSNNEHYTAKDTAGTKEETRPAKDQSQNGQLGSKIKAAMHVVHGIGENIRGTTLGAIDSLGNQGNTRHEDIARKGRLETEQAITTLKGQPVTSGVEGHDAAQASGVTGSAGAQGQGDQPHPEEKSEAGVGQPAQPYQSSSMSRDQGGPGAAAGVGGGSGGSESYHYRDYPVTNNNVIQGEQKSGTSQLSSADQKQAPSYDPNTAGDRQ